MHGLFSRTTGIAFHESFLGLFLGKDVGFGGETGTRLGSSMRDRHVAVRDDQGPRTLTGRKPHI